jgi:hypothetical protein
MKGLVAAAACAVVALCGSGRATAAVSCTYDATTRTVSEHLGANDTDTIYLSTTGTIESSSTGTCGAATLKNTDRVVVTGDPLGSESFTISEQNGPFTRAKGPRKSRGEIAFSVDLGGSDPNFFTSDALMINGSPGNDTIAVGAAGVALNTEGNLDVSVVNDPDTTVNGELGNDTITAQGGYGSGTQYASSRLLRLFGMSERDSGAMRAGRPQRARPRRQRHDQRGRR